LVVLLAVCSVVPVLNLLSLGYLLHASGRVAVTGRLRDGFPGLRRAAVLGRVLAGSWLVLWPARLVADAWRDAELISPSSRVAQGWRVALMVILAVTLLHLVWACLRGAGWRHFIWHAPLRLLRWLRHGESLQQVRAAVRAYVLGLRLPSLFWLGLRGFLGAAAWLLVPVCILLAATRAPLGGAVALSLLGGVLLMLVVLHLPFMQVRLASTDRLAAMFELREVRRLFTQAPLAFAVAVFFTVLLAMPLYLLKIELTPRELAWLPALLFVLFLYPARLLTGWAVSRASRRERRERPVHAFWRWSARLSLVPVALAYAAAVYVAPYLSWNGALSLLEQHAFLVPAPLFAL
jgi:hypothetical protein